MILSTFGGLTYAGNKQIIRRVCNPLFAIESNVANVPFDSIENKIVRHLHEKCEAKLVLHICSSSVLNMAGGSKQCFPVTLDMRVSDL